MAGIIPKSKLKGVDFCGTSNYCYIIRSDLGCYMRAKDFRAGSDISIHALHPCCRHGDHYLADSKGFYIKGDECRRVRDLTEDTDSSVFTLPPNCRGGDHYLSGFMKYTAVDMVNHINNIDEFYIIFQEKGRRTRDLSNDSVSKEFPLHPNCRDALYFWGDRDHVYFLKQTEWGVEYYEGTNFNRDEGTALSSVHPDVLNFLPGGLSITNGPAFSKWVNIKTVDNDSPTPVTLQKKVTKKVGDSKEKMSEITHNWKIETSGKITAGKLAGLISECQFSFTSEYGGAHVNTEKENWNEDVVKCCCWVAPCLHGLTPP